MKTSSRKAKGRRLQKLVAGKISELTGLPHGKDSEIESRPMGQSGCDIRLSQKARSLFPFSVECKNKESWDVHSSIQQARTNCYPGTDWLLVFGRNNQQPVVIMDMEVFFDILGSKMFPMKERTKN